MGASQSTSQAPPRALHVLRVTPSSPAAAAALEPFFDFIVGFRDTPSGSPAGTDLPVPSARPIDVGKLEQIVESHEGKTLDLLVWNSKSQSTRVVPITPSRAWAQLPSSTSSDANAKPSLLGLSMRMCEPELALDNVWHVLDVLEGSPAEDAGFVPYGDWVIGWAGGVLSAEGDFYEVVEAHIGKSLRVYVYSYDFDTIREVVLVPNREWGGEGLLGCVFGFGLLHRIPPLPDRSPGALPAELIPSDGEWSEGEGEPESLFADDEYDDMPSEARLFVPADAIYDGYDTEPQPPHAPQPVHAHGAAHAHTPERAATPRARAQPNINGHGHGPSASIGIGAFRAGPGSPAPRRSLSGYGWPQGMYGRAAGVREDEDEDEDEDADATTSVADTEVTATSLTSVD